MVIDINDSPSKMLPVAGHLGTFCRSDIAAFHKLHSTRPALKDKGRVEFSSV